MTHKELGQQLRIARERLGLDIKEAAVSIRIDSKFIEKMESGDFTFLAEVYVRSFVKEYAVVLQLNPDEVLDAYKKAGKDHEPKPVRQAPQVQTPPQAPPPQTVYQPVQTPQASQESLYNEPEQHKEQKPERPKVDYQAKMREMLEKFMAEGKGNFLKGLIGSRKGYITLGVIAVALILILYAIFSGKPGKTEITTDNKKVDELITGVQDTTNKFAGTTLPEAKLPPDADTVILVLNTKDTTRIKAVIDKTDTLKQIVLEPAVPRTLNASKRIDLRVENSSILSVILNDKPLNLPKKKGIQTFNIDKNGLITKTAPKNEKRPKKKNP